MSDGDRRNRWWDMVVLFASATCHMSYIPLRLLQRVALRPTHPRGFFDSARSVGPNFQHSFTSPTFVPSTRLPNILQIIQTRFLNATHRSGFRLSNRVSSGWGRPPRRDWWDSLDSNVIFYGIIAINAGVYLAWQSAASTYVRSHLRHPCSCVTVHVLTSE